MSTQVRRPIWPLLVAALVIFAGYSYWTVEVETAPTESRPPGGAEEIAALAKRTDTNVLFILVDTFRANRMSAYGYERETTPFLANLASSGIRFERNISQSSWTKSSMASMWSGLLPLRAGVTRYDQTISSQIRMPAEIMKEAGFKTVGLYRNGWVSPYFGFDQGFEKYYHPLGGMGQDPNIQRMRPNAQAGSTDEHAVADAIEFLRIHGESSRWFLYLHLMDLHEYTYDQESALFGNGVSDLYDNSIRRTDWVISTLYDYLGRRKLLDKTIVVIASDHGEAFGERGFEGHGREVFPETTETPWIISLPFALSPGIVVSERSNNVDIWPTVLDLLGLPSQGDEIDGRSRREEILAAARGVQAARSAEADDVSVSYLDETWGTPNSKPRSAISIVDGDYRYVAGTDFASRPFEVLLSTEDGQTENRIATNPEIADRLRNKAREVTAETPVFDADIIELDEMQLNQLRALGYELP